MPATAEHPDLRAAEAVTPPLARRAERLELPGAAVRLNGETSPRRRGPIHACSFSRRFLAGTAALAASPGGAPVHADTTATWTVSPGGAATTTATAGTITLTDIRTGAVGTCASSKVTGTLKKGSGLPGQDIGTVTAAAFGSCAALGSVPLTVTPTGLPWRISLTSYHPTTGVVAGTVSGVDVVLTGTCDAVVNGTSGPADGVVSALYNDRIGQLTFLASDTNLHYWHVKNCHQLINDGDPVALTASYAIRPLQDITSP